MNNKMNRIVVILVMMVISLSGFSQTGKQDYERFKKVYDRAMKYNDFPVAKNALYNMLAADPENDSVLYTLAYYYFDSQSYASCLMVCMDIIAKNPNELGIIEAMAVSYENLGLLQKSLEAYEKLYLLTDNINSLYKTTFIQFELKRYDECETNIDILLSKKEVDELKLVYTFEENKQEEFPMRVSVLNLKGALLIQQGDTVEARKTFEEVLALAPNFKLAKENLASLK